MVERVRFLVENKIEVKKVDDEGNTAVSSQQLKWSIVIKIKKNIFLQFHYLANYGINLEGQSKPCFTEVCV
jgi:hypothetical protein